MVYVVSCCRVENEDLCCHLIVDTVLHSVKLVCTRAGYCFRTVCAIMSLNMINRAVCTVVLNATQEGKKFCRFVDLLCGQNVFCAHICTPIRFQRQYCVIERGERKNARKQVSSC